MIYFATFLPDWNSLESVRHAHSFLEGTALVLFALLVASDILAHLNKKREQMWERIGLCFFAIAVFAEIVAFPYGQRNDTLSEQLIGSLDAQAKEASNNAAKAIAESGTALFQAQKSEITSGNALILAKGARKEADSFETDIVSAKRQATEAESHLADALKQAASAAAELARFRAPRRLTSEQQLEIVSKLRAFAPQRVNIFAYSGDSEILGITNEIGTTTLDSPPKGAGWAVSGMMGTENGRAVSGILVEITEKAGTQSLEAANALVRALRNAGLTVTGAYAADKNVTAVGSGDSDPSAQIRIVIGKKE